jgi:hypothetical protein
MSNGKIYHITADIDRVETSVTVAGRRISVRAALILTAGTFASIGLSSLLLPAFGTPALAIPLGLAPLYLTAIVAFVRAPDGRHWETHLIDRYRFARSVKRAVNLRRGDRLEETAKIINLRQEVIPVVDTTLDAEPIRRTLHDVDLPVTIEAIGGLRMAIDNKVLVILHDATRNRIQVTVSRREPGDSPAPTTGVEPDAENH